MHEIFEEARKDALKAAREKQAELFGGNEPHHDGFPCGFAWVHLPDARASEVKWLKSEIKKLSEGARHAYGSKHWKKGWQIWNPSCIGVQNLTVKEAGSHAYAKVLREYGFECNVGSRLD